MLNKRLVRADLVLHVPRFEHQSFGISCCRWFLFHEKHHSQGFLGSELAWNVQTCGRLHRRAVIFVIMIMTDPLKEIPNVVTLSESRPTAGKKVSKPPQTY